MLTQDELAAKAGVSKATIVALESGRTRAFASTLRKLAAALEVQPSELRELLAVRGGAADQVSLTTRCGPL